MRKHSLWLLAAMFFVTAACSVNVKKDEQGNDKKVDIDTPFGGIHVNENADVRDTGLQVYPGARVKPKDNSGDEKSANVNISTSGFGLKVVAVEYQSDDAPAKIMSFYQNQLKKYGSVLVCHTSHEFAYTRNHRHDSNELKCDSDNGGNIVELKVGTEDNQHVVTIEPKEKGSDFSLVYVQVRGKEGTI